MTITGEFMRHRFAVVVVILNVACQGSPARENEATRPPTVAVTSASDSLQLSEGEADSLVLERRTCYGTCDAYRVAITREDVVHFESRTPGDSGRTVVDTLRGRQRFESVIGKVLMTHFLALPDSITVDEPFCRPPRANNPFATVTLYARGRVKRVVDYLGCPWAPSGIRELEVAVDRIAGVERWAERP